MNGKIKQRVLRLACFLLCAVFFCVSLSSAAFAYSGYEYTNSDYLASRLDEIFYGSVPIFQNEDKHYPVGSSIGTYPDSPHRVAGLLGYECYIYANAVYYYLFGDVPYHGSSDYTRSTVPVRGGSRITYKLLHDNNINCGAYVRTTSSSDGTYNGSSGHSFIILGYDEEGIDVLQANNAGPGIISLEQWDWETLDTMFERYWGGHISHIINPNSAFSTSADGEIAVHSWTDWITAVEAGCYKNGYSVRVCADCGKVEKKIIPAGHSWDGGSVTVPATWEHDGEIIYTCTVCGVTEPGVIPKITLSDFFNDIVPDGWYCPYVEYAFRNGLMQGMSDGVFAPDEKMNRAMIVTVLWRIEGEPEPADDAPFFDLKSDWYRKAVAWAAEAGIVMGVDDENFAPDGPLTREQIAAIMYRYSEYKGRDITVAGEPSGFPDECDVSEYARDALAWAVGSGILKGTSVSGGIVILDPRGGATRAQVATILTRYLSE